jgi:hypothetical protein
MRRAPAGVTQVAKTRSNLLQVLRFVTKTFFAMCDSVAKTGGAYLGLIDAGK